MLKSSKQANMSSIYFLLETSFAFIILAATSVYRCHANNAAVIRTSLVFGLTHSRIGSSNSNNHHPLQLADLSEPLREIRDGYLIPLSFGTPPQVIQVYMDTGSDLTWLPCTNHSPFDCIECDDNTNSIILRKNILFSPSHSSSSLRDSCSSPYCIDIHSSDNLYDPCAISGCSLTDLMKFTCIKPCPAFSYTYGDDRVIVGTLSKDVLGVHGVNGVMEIPKFRFGCVGAAYGEPIGIAGFGRGSLSLLSQLGFLQKGFSHCFLPFKFSNNPNITSPLIIGERAIDSKEHLQFTPMLKSPKDRNLYYIGLESVSVGNKASAVGALPKNLKEIDSLGNGGMLMDSGTTYTHLPDPVYTQLLTALKAAIRYPRAVDVEEKSGFDLCYTIPCGSNKYDDEEDDDIPLITFHFLNNIDLVLPKENCFYAMGAPSNSSVVKCLLIQSMADGEYGPAGVFGSFQQQNMEVVYDLNKERVGFMVTDCALSAASHGLHTA